MDAPATKKVETPAPVYVYQWPIRLWHWLTSASLVVLGASGWVIANPVADWGTGWPRLVHFITGDVLAVAMLFRVYWAIAGGARAREIFVVPAWKKAFWAAAWDELEFYLFLGKGRVYVGHNPLARLAMLFLFVGITLFMIATGFALYGEDVPGGVMSRMFGWVFSLIGPSQTVRTFHHLGMWGLAVFACIHVYMASRQDIMGEASSVSTMIGGWRYFKPGSRRGQE